MKRKNVILVIMLLLFLGFTIYFLLGHSSKKVFLSTDENAQDWEGNQKLPSGTKANDKTIKVPGISSLVFIANQRDQKVNFYNPKENTCLFRMTLYIEDKQYWQSGYVDPGKGYYDITLDDVLKIGEYDGALLVECFKNEGAALNNARIEFNLKVVDE